MLVKHRPYFKLLKAIYLFSYFIWPRISVSFLSFLGFHSLQLAYKYDRSLSLNSQDWIAIMAAPIWKIGLLKRRDVGQITAASGSHQISGSVLDPCFSKCPHIELQITTKVVAIGT